MSRLAAVPAGVASVQTVAACYRRGGRHRALLLSGVAVVLLALLFADLLTGPSPLTAREALAALAQGPGGADRMAAVIVWSLRLPATLMGLVVGMALGMAGLAMQTILDNPLASPFTLGFSAAAGFGAALAILFGAAIPLAAWILIPGAAFAATLVSCGLVYAIARLRGANAEILVLGGIAVLFLFQALQSLLQYLASPEALQQIVFWLFGSLQRANWTSVAVVSAIAAAATPLLARDAWALTALRLGEAHARGLGVETDALRRRGLALVALLTAGAVAFTGTIGFVGLVAPHAGRALVGEDQRALLPMSALMGGVILVGASVAAKLLSPGTALPVGIVTAVTGVPILFWLVARRGAGGWG